MKRTKTSVLALLVLAIAVTTLSGCGKKALIRVNGEKITKDEFYSRLERVPVQTPQGPQMAGRYVVQQLIAEKLVEQLAKEQKVAPTEEQINKKINFIKKQSGDLRKVLAARGMTLDDLKHQIAVEQAFVNIVSKGVNIPESKVRKVYEDGLKSPNSPWVRPEQVRISAIICSSKDKAEKAYKLLKSGTEFGTVAMQYSEDELSKQTQGVVGWVARNSNVPKIVKDLAFGLKPGQFSQPTLIEGKWVIIKADQRRPKKITPYEDVKDVIREQLAIQEGSKKNDFRTAIRNFTKKADIQVTSSTYKDIPQMIKKEAAKAIELAKPGATGTPGTPAAPTR